MGDRIGPTFWAEVTANGVSRDGWSIDDVSGVPTFTSAVSADVQTAVLQIIGAHDPTKALPPTVTGNQWAFALADLGLSSAWQVGKAKSKAKDQIRVDLISRDTPLLASDPMLIRVAANAGTADGTAGGAPLIDVPTVHAHARDMPL